MSLSWVPSADRGLLSRLPAAIKLAALFVLGIAVYLVPGQGPRYALLALAVLAVGLCGGRAAALGRAMLGLTVFVLAIFAVTALTVDLGTAVSNVVRLSTLFLFALAVTASTRYSAVLEVFDKMLAPLRHLGLRPERISLTLALTIRFIPEIRARYLEIREAQYARGLQNRPLATMVPLLIRTLTDAEDISAALDARGYDTDE